jgi:hypothetical protein
MSNYRDDLGAAQDRAAALEEELQDKDELLEGQATRIADLERALADKDAVPRPPRRRKKKRTRTAEEDEELSDADDDVPASEPVRKRLVQLSPKANADAGSVIVLALRVGLTILFLLTMLMR